MQVVWTGTMEREAAEAVRRAAVAPLAEPPKNHIEIVLAYLVQFGSSTAGQIFETLNLTKNQVNTALYHLRRRGEVVIDETREPIRVGPGFKLSRFYKAVTQ